LVVCGAASSGVNVGSATILGSAHLTGGIDRVRYDIGRKALSVSNITDLVVRATQNQDSTFGVTIVQWRGDSLENRYIGVGGWFQETTANPSTTGVVDCEQRKPIQ
jgi:hypothetical protein